MNNTFKRNYYFLPASVGLLICFLSIRYANHQNQIQKVVLILGVLLGVLRVLWGQRAKQRFALSLGLITIAHVLILTFLSNWFPLGMCGIWGSLPSQKLGICSVLGGLWACTKRRSEPL